MALPLHQKKYFSTDLLKIKAKSLTFDSRIVNVIKLAYFAF